MVFRKCTIVRVDTITGVILERAGPVIFKAFYRSEFAFELIPVLCPARRAIPDRASPEIKSVNVQKLIPGNHFPDQL